MAHSWVADVPRRVHGPSILTAACNPDSVTLLVDTYNVLKSGVPNAIRAFQKHGITKCAIRIVSGDLTYLSKKARRDAG